MCFLVLIHVTISKTQANGCYNEISTDIQDKQIFSTTDESICFSPQINQILKKNTTVAVFKQHRWIGGANPRNNKSSGPPAVAAPQVIIQTSHRDKKNERWPHFGLPPICLAISWFLFHEISWFIIIFGDSNGSQLEINPHFRVLGINHDKSTYCWSCLSQ